MHRLALIAFASLLLAACASPPAPQPAGATQTAAAEQCKRQVTGSLIPHRAPCAKSDEERAQDQRDMETFRDRTPTPLRSTGPTTGH